MARVDYYECDRCGKQFPHEDYGATVKLVRVNMDDQDICKNCSFELRTWIEKGKD